jgi:hypothetical protein
MIPRLSTLTHDIDQAQRASARVSWALSKNPAFAEAAIDDFRRRGHGRFVKTAVDPILSTDAGVPLQPLDAALVALIDARSAIGALVAAGAYTFPLLGAARLQLGEVVAADVAEGDPKPVTQMHFSVPGLPTKVAATIVASAEAVRSIDATTQSGLRDVLVAACARASDRALVDVLTAGPPSSSAAIGDLFSQVSGGAPSAPVLMGGLDALLALDASETAALGAIGVTLVPTPAATGKVIAVDATGVLVGDGGIELATAQHANLLLDDGTAPPSATVVNLWQQNLVAFRAERLIRLALRSGACAWAPAAAGTRA